MIQDKALALLTYFNCYLGADNVHSTSDLPT